MDWVGRVEGGGNEKRNLIASVWNNYLIKTTATITTPTKRKIYFATKKKKKTTTIFPLDGPFPLKWKEKNEAVTPWVSLAQDVSNL